MAVVGGGAGFVVLSGQQWMFACCPVGEGGVYKASVLLGGTNWAYNLYGIYFMGS
ncbi:hypothetical protein MnBA_11600 [Marinobacterium sp. BA1]